MPTDPRAALLMTVQVTAGAAMVSVRGDLDASAAAEIAEVLAQVLAAEPGRIVLDMTYVGFLDCSAAGAIFAAARSLPDGRPVIRSPRRIVRRLLEITGLDAQCILEDRLVPDPAARMAS